LAKEVEKCRRGRLKDEMGGVGVYGRKEKREG
jgi:hypothetical protein